MDILLMNRKGFTIIEVLVSLIILSIIAIISSNILQSSLDTERDTTRQLNSIKELNLSSSIIRRDIRQIVNIPSRYFFGNTLYGTLIGSSDSESISFSTRIKSLSNEVSPIKRVEYVLEKNILVRRQYFSSNPYDQSAYTESKLLIDFSELRFSFMYDNKWHSSWPINLATSKKIPTIIKLDFTTNNKEYLWMIEPNILYANQDYRRCPNISSSYSFIVIFCGCINW
jgi:type II secretion system protein J